MPKTYLNDRGEPIGDSGSPPADPTAITPHELNLRTPQKISEPTNYWGGFMKGLRDYGKDLVSDPTTMAGVGSGIALATTPVTGPWGLAAAGALGAAGGAGGAHIIKQLRSGPEDASDVLGSMALEGGVGGAMTAIPPVAGKAGKYLIDRASRLAAPEAATGTERVIASALRRHGPAAVATHFLGPGGGAAVEAAQSPMVNRTAGRVLEGVGEIPDAMRSLMGRVSGAGRTAALEDAAAARQAAFRQGMTRPEPMTPFSPFAERPASTATWGQSEPMTPWSSGFGETGAEAAAPEVAAAVKPPVPSDLPGSADPKLDELQQFFARQPASMASLESGDAGLGSLAEDLPYTPADDLARSQANVPSGPFVAGGDAFHANFLQQLMGSLARAR